MRLEEKLATLFHHQKISSVLDLGVVYGDWYQGLKLKF